MQEDSALALLRAAREADPDYFPAQYDFLKLLRRRRPSVVETQRAMVGAAGSDSACLGAVTAAPWPPFADAPVRALHDSLTRLVAGGHGSACTAVFLALLLKYTNEPAPLLATRVLGHMARAVALAPSLPDVWLTYAEALGAQDRWEMAAEVLQRGVRLVDDPLGRTILYGRLVAVWYVLGDSARADALIGSLDAATARSDLAGLRVAFLMYPPAVQWSFDQAQTEIQRLASAAGAWWIEWGALANLGTGEVDRGRPNTAVPLYSRLVAIADSVGAPRLRLEAYVRRGRAYAKMGGLEEAERDLLRAVGVGRGGDRGEYFAEAYHNLAHVYEAMGRTREASWAADSFVAIAGESRYSGLRMMSLHDAALIRWKAGWHASANAAFAELVSVVDDQRDNRYWAGQFFERTGDLRRALAYYRLGVDAPASNDRGEDAARLLAGLSRVYDALGARDSAEAAAARHDRLRERWTPLEAPLLPIVLARHGRTAAAVDGAREWAATQLARGNVHGAAVAQLQTAGLLLAWGRPDDARSAALEARRLATRLNLTDELIESLRLEGLAVLQRGDTVGAIGLLGRAVRTATDHPTATALMRTQTALADALARTEPGRALDLYDAAARVVEAGLVRLEVDLDRVGFKERHLAPYDGAVRLLLRAGDTAAIAPLLAWSGRRKAAALRLATDPSASAGAVGGAVSLEAWQGRLAADEAMLDYVVVDSLVAVTVVTRRRATVVPLPVRADSVRGLIGRLRAPLTVTFAGRLDLARAPFDLDVAHALYRALVEPAAATLDGVTRLRISSDDALHTLPFDALVVAEPADNGDDATRYAQATYLLDAYEVAYVPFVQGPGYAAAHARARGPADRVVAVATRVPGGESEVAAIRAAWPGRTVVVLEGKRATETELTALAGSADVLHFAAHAVVSDRDPLESHLRLVADERHDGLLHLGEIGDLALRPRLVVLSTCESAAGRLYRGEGLMGLARAFLLTGTDAVVATLWPVGASAADVVGEFHTGVSRGTDPAAALRAAQLALRSRVDRAHPFYWAGFVLILGNGRAIAPARRPRERLPAR